MSRDADIIRDHKTVLGKSPFSDSREVEGIYVNEGYWRRANRDEVNEVSRDIGVSISPCGWLGPDEIWVLRFGDVRPDLARIYFWETGES